MLSHKIKRVRVQAGLSIAQLARAIGITSQSVWAWEQGLSAPRWAHIEAIAEATGTTISLRFLDDHQSGAEADIIISIIDGVGADKRKNIMELLRVAAEAPAERIAAITALLTVK